MSEEDSSSLKQTIVGKAREGAFNNNPLLSAIHSVTCRGCGHRQRAVFLEFLRSGEFELGKVEQVEALDTQGPTGFVEIQKVTPVVLMLACEKCGRRIEAQPVSAEYLNMIISRPRAAGTMIA